MLYVIQCANKPELAYRGGQEPILHLEADLRAAVEWAERDGKRWAFTLSNAGGSYFEDRSSLDDLNQVNWAAVRAAKWSGPGVSSLVKEGKQAEFLMEERFPWQLVERIGVFSARIAEPVVAAMDKAAHKPKIEVRREWYY